MEPLQHYTLSKTLGVGTFGKVKLAKHNLTGISVAIKIMNRKKISSLNMDSKVQREIQILKSFNHINIIRLYEVIETETDIYMVMEYAAGGELFDHIVKLGRCTEAEARRIFQQIIFAVDYCHRRNVAHRDLKPENLMVDNQDNVKVGDFGLSNVMQDGYFLKTSCGSPNYAAPEVIQGLYYFGPEVDIWSCGIILFALLCGHLPFDDVSVPVLFRKILNCEYHLPSHVSDLAQDLIPKMLVVDPLKRIPISEIKEHPWFQIDLKQNVSPDYSSNIDTHVLTEVCNSYGFNYEELLNALSLGTTNPGTVTYNLLLDQRKNREDYQPPTSDRAISTGCPIPGASAAVEAVQKANMEAVSWSSSPGNHFETLERRDSDPDSLSRGRWSFGLLSHFSPKQIMMEIFRVLKDKNLYWKRLGTYEVKCALFFESSPTADGAAAQPPHKEGAPTDSTWTEKPLMTFSIHVFKSEQSIYFLDIHRISGSTFRFMDVCNQLMTSLQL